MGISNKHPGYDHFEQQSPGDPGRRELQQIPCQKDGCHCQRTEPKFTAREQSPSMVRVHQEEQLLLSPKVMGLCLALGDKHLLTVWLMKRTLLVVKREKGENHT